MSNLAADKVLRVNCPGWGVSSTLPLGEAKPLAMYDVLVINPTSIIHLFEPKSDSARQIDKLLQDGSSLFKLDSDSTLESIGAELELREHELRQFLSKGGLLVYFLAPPFTVSGTSMRMDNFLWLYEFGPDKFEDHARTMTPGKGKEITLSARGKQHVFAPFLQQLGIEYNTYIRQENLTDGYRNLANGAAGKCVAAYKSSGPRRGQVVFLPAPYETRYDDMLKECILKWHELRTGPDADKPESDEVESAENEPDIEGRALLNNLFADDSDSSKKSDSYAEPAMSKSASAPSDFDSLDALFAPSSKSESGSKSDDDDPMKMFDDVKKGGFADPTANLFEESPGKVFDEPASTGEKKKKGVLDWPELEDDVPPFSKEREKEREKEKERERGKSRNEDKSRSSERKGMEPAPPDFAAALASELNSEVKLQLNDDDDFEDSEDDEDAEDDRDREREKAREEERDRDRERERERAREEERDREREKAREEERDREREKAREEEREREREKAREEEKDRERERAKEESRDRERERMREEERARERDIEDREREKARGEERERDKAREMQRELDRAREEERERQKSRDEEREREDAREKERAHSPNGGESERTSTFPEAKDLMSRMEQEISSPGVPDWCQKVSFTELKQLHFELGDLNEQVRKARQKINDIEDRIRTLGELKDALLSLSGLRLTQACCKVFELLGWSVKISETSAGEVWLSEGDKTQAIVRIVFSLAQPNRSELAELAESVITYWGKYDIEPKGILVASTFAEKAPKDRTEEDFPGSMGEFAKRKNLCLFTSLQLLTLYRDVAIKGADVRKIRENLLTTSGILPGFKLEMSDMPTAEAATK